MKLLRIFCLCFILFNCLKSENSSFEMIIKHIESLQKNLKSLKETYNLNQLEKDSIIDVNNIVTEDEDYYSDIPQSYSNELLGCNTKHPAEAQQTNLIQLSEKLERKKYYDIHNRTYLLSEYTLNRKIIDFIILNFKALYKLGNGFFSNKIFVVLTSDQNSYLDIYDENFNQIFSSKLEFEAVKLISFNSNEEREIFILAKSNENNKEGSTLKKLTVDFYSKNIFHSHNINPDNNNNSSNTYDEIQKFEVKGERILEVETFREVNNKYSIKFLFDKNKDRNNFFVKEESFYNLELEALNLTAHITKGNKYIIIETHNEFIILNDKLNLISKFQKSSFINYYDTHFQVSYLSSSKIKPFLNYIGIIYNKSSIFHIFNLRNMNEVLIEIDINNAKYYDYTHGFEEDIFYNTSNNENKKIIDNKTNNIIAYTFDQLNNLLYFVTQELNLFVVTIKISTQVRQSNEKYFYDIYGNINSMKNPSSNTPDSYQVAMIINLKKYFSVKNANNCDAEVVRKDLFIRVGSEFVIINLDSFNPGIKDAFAILPQIQYKKIINKVEKASFIKNSNGYYFLLSYGYKLFFYEIIPQTSAFIGQDEFFNFNFKVPIIFIALIILGLYHFLFKKKQISEQDTSKLKEELLSQLKKEGVDLNDFKKKSASKNDKNSKLENDLDLNKINKFLNESKNKKTYSNNIKEEDEYQDAFDEKGNYNKNEEYEDDNDINIEDEEIEDINDQIEEEEVEE